MYRDDRLNVAKMGLRGAGYRDDKLNVAKMGLSGAVYRDDRLNVAKMGLRGAGHRDDKLNVAKIGLRGAGYRDDRLNVAKMGLRGAGYRDCHVSGKTSVLAVRCCCFVTNNNGRALTHTCMRSHSNHTRHALTHALWVIHSRTRSLSRNIILTSQPRYFIQFTIVILTTATLLHNSNVNPGATK